MVLKLPDSETERLLRRLDAARHGLDNVMVVAPPKGSASLTYSTTPMEICKVLLQCDNPHMCPSSSRPPGTYWLESIHVGTTTPYGIDNDTMLVLQNAPAQMRSSLHDAPKLTLRRLLHSPKHLSPSSTTLSGIDNDTMFVKQNASAQMRSGLDDAPKTTLRRLLHS